MKKILFAVAIICAAHQAHAQVGIGITAPAASSILELNSTSKGLLIPRMTDVERGNITSPATGLMVYQTNATPGFYYYNGSAWVTVASTAAATTNSTVTGTGVSGSPLGINLNNSNTWTANQTFAGTFLITSNSRIALVNSDNFARDIRFQEPSGTGSQFVGFRAPNLTNNGAYMLPAVVGSVGQALTLASSNNLDSASMQWTSVAQPATIQFHGTVTNAPTYAASAGSTMVFNNAITNVGNQMSTTTGNFVATAAGLYDISASAAFTTQGGRYLTIRVNGVDVFNGASGTGSTSFGAGFAASTADVRTLYPLSAGDVVTVNVYTNASTAVPFGTGATTRLLITKMN